MDNARTRADLIRQMSDQDLAEMMVHTGDCPPDVEEHSDLCWQYRQSPTFTPCRDCWMDYLKQEVDEP